MDFIKRHKLKLAGACAAAGVLLLISTEPAVEPRKKGKMKKAEEGNSGESSPAKSGPSEQEILLKAIEVPKVGTGMDLQPDYCGGLLKLAEKIDSGGSGIGYVDMFGSPTVILTNPEFVRLTLAHNVYNAHWGGITSASRAFFGEKVLFILMGDEWRQLRNTMKFALTKNNLALLKSDLYLSSCRFADVMEENIGKEVDVNLLCGMYHLDAIARCAYDYDFGCLEHYRKTKGPNEIVKSFEYLLQELPRRSLAPDQSVLGDYEADNEDNRKWKHAADNVRNLVVAALDARMKKRSAGLPKRNDLLDSLIDAYEEDSSGDEKVFQHISDNLVEILFAGYNTNVGTIATALYHLSRDTDLLRKVQKEVDSVIPDSYVSGEIDDSKLVLCKAVFKETLRLNPPAPLVSRFTVDEVSLQDKYLIPKNTSVWFPAEYLHKSKALWGDDALVFNPERWMKSKPAPTGSFIPFSHGPRECIGKGFAEIEAIAALSFLIKRLEFKVADDYKAQPIFTGFGYRPFDATTKKVCLRMIPTARR